MSINHRETTKKLWGKKLYWIGYQKRKETRIYLYKLQTFRRLFIFENNVHQDCHRESTDRSVRGIQKNEAAWHMS